MGFASIGLGTGLFSADVPFFLLAAAFVPAVIAMVVIASQAGASAPVAQRATRAADEIARRGSHHG